MTLEPEKGNGTSTTQMKSLFTVFCRKQEKEREMQGMESGERCIMSKKKRQTMSWKMAKGREEGRQRREKNKEKGKEGNRKEEEGSKVKL